MTRTEERQARAKVNKALAGLPTYHNGLALADIEQILAANGFSALEPAIYCGRDGRLHEQVGPNTWLSLSWHKMDITGKYEIVAYVS